MIKNEDFSQLANDSARHDNKNGACKCGASHKPYEFEPEVRYVDGKKAIRNLKDNLIVLEDLHKRLLGMVNELEMAVRE